MQTHLFSAAVHYFSNVALPSVSPSSLSSSVRRLDHRPSVVVVRRPSVVVVVRRRRPSSALMIR